MQKKLIALAIAGLASTAAFAQSNVTVYGRVDYGYVNSSGSDGGVHATGTRSEFASGVGAGSRLGFKGAEDLGNGLKAIFELEYGLGVDNGGTTNVNTLTAKNPMWNRHSYVGLTGGFGTFVGGRVDGDRYSVWNSYDPFEGGTVANAASLSMDQVTRGDNAIAYISPDFSGFRVLTFYTSQLIGNENGGLFTASCASVPAQQNNCDLRGEGLNLEYSNGPIRATVNYEEFKAKNAAPEVKIKVSNIAASYDFGVAKVSALFDTHKTDNSATDDMRNWLVGISAPVGGSGVVRASYTRHEQKNDSNFDCNKFGIGYKYNLSKRTNIFTDYARISNSSSATCTITYSAAVGSPDYGSSGYGTKGFDLGIAHSF
jgi:predicted porin